MQIKTTLGNLKLIKPVENTDLSFLHDESVKLSYKDASDFQRQAWQLTVDSNCKKIMAKNTAIYQAHDAALELVHKKLESERIALIKRLHNITPTVTLADHEPVDNESVIMKVYGI